MTARQFSLARAVWSILSEAKAAQIIQPSYREMAERLGVAISQVGSAVDYLESCGYVVRTARKRSRQPTGRALTVVVPCVLASSTSAVRSVR